MQLPLVCVLPPDHKKAGLSMISSRDLFNYKFDIFLIMPKTGSDTDLVSGFLDELRMDAEKLDAKFRSRHPAFN